MTTLTLTRPMSNPLGFFARLAEAFIEARNAQRTYETYAGMSDAMLAQRGMTRADVSARVLAEFKS